MNLMDKPRERQQKRREAQGTDYHCSDGARLVSIGDGDNVGDYSQEDGDVEVEVA